MDEHVVFVEMSMTGAGEAAVEYAAASGYQVSVLTRAPDRVPPGPATVVACDTTDPAALRAALDRIAPVHGVTTTHDLFVPQAARAAEELGLPGMSHQAAAGVRNKHRMRQRLQQACPELNPPFRLVRDEAEALAAAAEWGYPVVAKPQDANDSWNVRRIETPEQLTAYVRAAADWAWDAPVSPGVLLEGFVDGEEFSVETAQPAGGARQLLGVTIKELAGLEQGHFAEVGTAFPLRDDRVGPIFHAVGCGLDALGIDCGVIHTEVRVRAGVVTILEVNPRLAGDMLGSHTIEAALGASPVAQVVEIALGHPAPWRPTRQGGAASWGIGMPRTGRYGGLVNEADLLADPEVTLIRPMVAIGTECRWPPEHNGDFVAIAITRAETWEQARDAGRRVAAAAEVRVL